MPDLLLIGALLAALGACAASWVALRIVWKRLQALEARLERSLAARPPLAPPESPSLAGLRVAISVRQDHPLSPFEALLAEALVAEGAVLADDGEDVRVVGTLKGNGYADVYFDADLTAEAQGQTVLRMRERPPHGDRPENLAQEVVARLRAEWVRRERQRALRELGA